MAACVMPNATAVASDDSTVRPTLRSRRLSMEEDYYYREIMAGPRRPSNPPAYDIAVRDGPPASVPSKQRVRKEGTKATAKATSTGEEKGILAHESPIATADIRDHEALPPYWCDVHAEGVFNLKMEIEETIKRAEDRHWHQCYVILHGTALKIYTCKKDRAWKRTQDGPGISPDNPPWVKPASLEKSYSLLHADAGIAADYMKRRYVIRLRAETDQFLLSCVELGTFVRWLECLFAAIDVASPLEEREFPRDHSIPRIQRLRWFRGHQAPVSENRLAELTSTVSNNSTHASVGSRPVTGTSYGVPDPEDTPPPVPPLPMPLRAEPGLSGDTSAQGAAAGHTSRLAEPAGRLSTTSYPNSAVDEDTGKWAPPHRWTTTHDHLYAKLCYAVLLFRSPRKSNYIIMKGKQWFVEWSTGRMFRVLPPAYDDPSEMFGPWQVIQNENRRI